MMGGTAPVSGHMRLLAVPASVRAGQITFVVYNRGWRIRELVVLPLASRADAGERSPGRDGKVLEGASLAEASRACAAGKGDGIPSGSAGWTTTRSCFPPAGMSSSAT